MLLRLRRAAARVLGAAAITAGHGRPVRRPRAGFSGARRWRRTIDTRSAPADTWSRVCRVAGYGCPLPAPSEPCVLLSTHTAQASTKASCDTRLHHCIFGVLLISCHFSRLKRSGGFLELVRRDRSSGFAGEGSSGQLQHVVDGVECLELRRTKQAQEDGVGFCSLH